MRYLVTVTDFKGKKVKLARFAYNSDAQSYALKLSELTLYKNKAEVLDTKLKAVSAVAVNGVCTFYKRSSVKQGG